MLGEHVSHTQIWLYPSYRLHPEVVVTVLCSAWIWRTNGNLGIRTTSWPYVFMLRKLHSSSYHLLILFNKAYCIWWMCLILLQIYLTKMPAVSKEWSSSWRTSVNYYQAVLYFALLLPFEVIDGVCLWQLHTVTSLSVSQIVQFTL